MYHFDYVRKRGGAVFENRKDGGMVSLNGQKLFTFDEFLGTFVFIENYRHPFTIVTTAKRQKRLNKQMEAHGYVPTLLEQIDFDFGDENAFAYGYHYAKLPNPFYLGVPC